MDRAWWGVHLDEVRKTFRGELHTTGILPTQYGVRRHQQSVIRGFANSGAAAIELAAYFGAARVVLLGYDCARTGGKAHWHGDHPPTLGNAGSIHKWPAHFRELAQYLGSRVQVLNASRETALATFPRVTLEEGLS